MNSLKLINIGQLVTYDSVKNEMVVFENTEIAIEGNHIKEVGQNLGDADQIFDCKNKLVTPGFVDPHTHPVFLDGRENEFAMRLQGATYEEIADALLSIWHETGELLAEAKLGRYDGKEELTFYNINLAKPFSDHLHDFTYTNDKKAYLVKWAKVNFD